MSRHGTWKSDCRKKTAQIQKRRVAMNKHYSMVLTSWNSYYYCHTRYMTGFHLNWMMRSAVFRNNWSFISYFSPILSEKKQQPAMRAACGCLANLCCKADPCWAWKALQLTPARSQRVTVGLIMSAETKDFISDLHFWKTDKVMILQLKMWSMHTLCCRLVVSGRFQTAWEMWLMKVTV